MSRQSQPCHSMPVAASGAVTEHRFVTHAGAQAGAAANTLGISRFTVADKETMTVDTLGTSVMEAGGAINPGGLIETDANGKGVAKAAGPSVARAVQAASGDGEFIEVFLLPN